MSTLLTPSEIFKVPRTLSKMTSGSDEKRDRFVRSSSIEKIIKFNAYICSQNYFILPAILAWLKTSQSVLHANLEKIILFIKYLIFNSMAYRMLESKVELVAPSVLYIINVSLLCFAYYRDAVRLGTRKVAQDVKYRLNIAALFMKSYVFIVAVYFTVFVVFVQAVVCAGIVLGAFVTGGPTFLCVCLYAMLYIYLRILMDYLQKSEKNERSEKCDILRPKKILAKLDSSKTLSSMNLL
ncbi:uncharacterized protein LOC108736753 [Agrilus planipennis]|uniref:Uncharacterized protein LOC108736753 n=1 Tax=Agrilus planipennis TaxID=224129 RepID=A0A1W4WXF1_AGRPL|nr:uncharacterized protein LOC108736753 [Agrilus planipennis]XP_018324814.1 uncharacterized protein LOC108736753 [Agrilus planipennis]